EVQATPPANWRQTAPASAPSDELIDGSGFQPSLSADGRFVAYFHRDGSVGNIYLLDRQTHTTTVVSRNINGGPPNGDSEHPSISADGRYVAFRSFASDLVPGESANRQGEIFVFDRLTGATQRVSLGINGAQADGINRDPVISGDGRFVAFASGADNL